MTDPPRYSQRHFNWCEPVAPDGSIPLDYLMGWLKTNLANYRQSTDKQKVLGPLCRELNEHGVKCTVANIVVELECLTHTAWHSRTWITHAVYGEDLFECYFDGEESELVRSHRESHMRGHVGRNVPIGKNKKNKATSRVRSNCLRWLDGGGSSNGLSPMTILVSWFPNNFQKYAKSDKGHRCELLKELCDEIKSAGHSECSERGVAAKINQIRKEVELEYHCNHDRSECFKSYRGFFMNFFGYVDVGKNTEAQGKTKWRRRRERHRRSRSRSLVQYPLNENVAHSSSDSDAGTSSQSLEMEMDENHEVCDDQPKVEKDCDSLVHGNQEAQTSSTPPRRGISSCSSSGQRKILLSLKDVEIRTQVALCRKKLKDASVPDAEIDLLLPRPAQNPSVKYELSLEQIAVRVQASIGRQKLLNEGVPDLEVQRLLSMPMARRSRGSGHDSSRNATFPYKPKQVEVLIQLGSNRQHLRQEAVAEAEIDACLPLPNSYTSA